MMSGEGGGEIFWSFSGSSLWGGGFGVFATDSPNLTLVYNIVLLLN